MSIKPVARMCARRQRGVTLIEMIMFIVIVSIGLAGIIGVMALTTKQSADPVRRKQALILAEGLLEEVERAHFSYCDPADPDADNTTKITGSAACAIPEAWGQTGLEPAANGRPFDNVNDYVGAAGVSTAALDVGGKVADANGNVLNLNGYTARLIIRPAVLGGIGAAGTAADTDVLRITVHIDYDNNQSLELDGYRTRYAPYSL